MATVCRFRFPDAIDRETIETQLALAVIAAECTFGQPRVRIAAAYCVSGEKPRVVIDVSTEVGEHIAQVFTGLMIRQLGEDQFIVDRIDGKVGQESGNE
ncbi:MAG: hypothetical protein ABII79_13400 [bacterium]